MCKLKKILQLVCVYQQLIHILTFKTLYSFKLYLFHHCKKIAHIWISQTTSMTFFQSSSYRFDNDTIVNRFQVPVQELELLVLKLLLLKERKLQSLVATKLDLRMWPKGAKKLDWRSQRYCITFYNFMLSVFIACIFSVKKETELLIVLYKKKSKH